MQRAIEGVHEDTGRKVCINFDLPANAPIQLPDHLIAALDWVLKFAHGSDSLRSLAEYFDKEDSMGLGTTQGKNGNLGFFNAISKFMGNPTFCERLSISQKDVLRLDHLVEQYEDGQAITFQLMHRSQLDPKICPHDRVRFEEIHGQPYFIGDFNKTKPTGEMDIAATVKMSDVVWADSEFIFVGPSYYWHDQYLSELQTSKVPRTAILERLLYRQPVPGLGDVSYGDVVVYHAGGSREVELLALSEVSRPSNNVRIAGKDRLIVREGMGVVFETPLWITAKGDFLARIYGFVIAFKDDKGEVSDPRYPLNIQIRVHLAKENIPTWLLSRLSGSDLLQTNLVLTISEAYLVGVFSIWPPSLYQGTCVPGLSDGHVNDRIVVGHLQIRRRGEADEEGSSVHTSDSECEGEQGDKCGGSDDASTVISHTGARDDTPLQPFMKMHSGGAFIDVYRVKPMASNLALAYLDRQQQLTQSDRPDVHVKPLLHAFEQFCKDKTSKKLKTTQGQRTFRAPIPGRAMMALLRTLPEQNIRSVSLSNKTMVVTLDEPSFLDSVFSRKMSEFDFRDEGFGVVRLHGPVYFKWELCLSEDGCGPSEGRLSVTVGGWEDLNRFGTDAIKQSFEARAQPAKRANPSQASGRAPKTEKLTGPAAAKAKDGRKGGSLILSPNILGCAAVDVVLRLKGYTDVHSCLQMHLNLR